MRGSRGVFLRGETRTSGAFTVVGAGLQYQAGARVAEEERGPVQVPHVHSAALPHNLRGGRKVGGGGSE
jgi:hypothetical protein